MRKIFTLLALYFITVQVVTAQTVTDRTINFKELAAQEASQKKHPELFKQCTTCPKKEADRWSPLNNPNMAIPAGATIKKGPAPVGSNNPVPMAPSRAPAQTFLGHVDPGNVIPPDTHGAVGLNHVILATNDYIKIQNKAGGGLVSQVSISAFTGVGGTCDPYMIFDPSAQRWIFSAINCSNGTNNPMILMTSNTSDPTGTWRTITWIPTGGPMFLDHPYVAFDGTKIVLDGRRFQGGSSFVGCSLFLIDKAAMYAGTAITFGVNAQQIDKGVADGDAPCPVTVYDPPFSTVGNPSPGTFYVLQAWNSTSIRLTTVTGSIPACTWNTGSPVFPTSAGAPWNNGGLPNCAEQTIETRFIAENDARISSAVMMNGKLWCSHHISFPTSGQPTSTMVQWWELDGTPGGTFGNVIQNGRVNSNLHEYKYFPSLAVNKNEDVLIGFTSSTNLTQVRGAYVTRQIGTPLNTTDDELIYKAGQGRYWKDFGSGRTRWGDYSHSSLDPTDNSLWTIQEFASTPAGPIPPDNNSRYGTYWAQVAPSVVTATPVISPAGSALIAESCVPSNGAIDPGETVTVSLCLKNTGTANTTSLVATLQNSGGVLPVTVSQNYGAVPNDGSIHCMNFTFSNSSSICGGSITASLQLQDGATNLGTISYNFTLGVLTTTLLTNGGFETGTLANWTTIASTPAPVVNATSPHSGTFAAFLGNLPGAEPSGNAAIYQQITVPASGGILNYWYKPYSEDGITFDWQDAYITNTSGTILATIMHVCSNSQTYTLQTFDLTPFAGQTVRVEFLVHQDGFGDVTNMYVDDVSISQYNCCGAPCVITCPGNITVNNDPGQCGAIVSYPPATTTGLCGPVTYSQNSGTFFPKGTTTVTATSASGSSCTFTITVNDTQPPTITCPANITRANDPNLCSAVVTYPLPTYSDNCGMFGPQILSQNLSNSVGPTIQIGCQSGGFNTDNSYWRAFNLGGMGLPGPLTVNSVTFGIETAQASGASQPITVRLWTSAGAFPGGVRTLVASQVVNVPNQTNTLFTVNLTVPPTVPANAILVYEVFTPDGRPPVNNKFFIGSNNLGQTAPCYISAAPCGIPTPVTLASLGFPNDHQIMTISGVVTGPNPLIQTAGLPSGSAFPVGTTTNTFKVTDASGNMSTCSFNVTVNDTQAPSVTCPVNIVSNTDVGLCTATIATPNPVTSDNCGVTKITWVMTGATTGSSPASGINYVGTQTFNLTGTTGQGITTITYTVSDAAGNTTVCSYTVTVNDAWIPVISGQPTDQFVCVGSNGVFSVTASVPTGNPLTYQWQAWNGSSWVNIAGATSASLTLPSVAFTMNTNTYRVILTGRCSVVTSAYATLYVNPLPMISLLTSRSPALLPGQSLDLTAIVSPGGGTYQWYKNGTAIAGATGSVLAGLTVDDIGTYKCVYTDGNGCVSTSSDLVVSGQASDKLYVYPNPNTGQFQVRFYNSANEPVTVTIYDSKGAKVYSKALVTTTPYTRIDVNISTLSAGTYMVEVINSAGKRVGAKKFVMYHN